MSDGWLTTKLNSIYKLLLVFLLAQTSIRAEFTPEGMEGINDVHFARGMLPWQVRIAVRGDLQTDSISYPQTNDSLQVTVANAGLGGAITINPWLTLSAYLPYHWDALYHSDNSHPLDDSLINGFGDGRLTMLTHTPEDWLSGGTSLGLLVAIHAGTANRNNGFFVRNPAFIRSDQRATPWGRGNINFETKFLFSLNANKLKSWQIPFIMHWNLGYAQALDDYPAVWSLGNAMEFQLTENTSFTTYLSWRGNPEDKSFSQMAREFLQVGLAMDASSNAGFHGSFGLSINPLEEFNVTQIERSGAIRSEKHLARQLKIHLGISWTGLLFSPDKDDDGVPDEKDDCPAVPEDRDGFQDHDGCPDVDIDSDGVPDINDQCLYNAEDTDGYRDTDGCPDWDNDMDGMPDNRDDCPDDAEDKDNFKDQDGCPDKDNDEDGVPDEMDKCPIASEDIDGFEDEDGCPDRDNDDDGIEDRKDQCPEQKEDFNHFEDEDGCPDVAPKRKTVVFPTPAELKQVHFRAGQDRLTLVAMGVLEKLGRAMTSTYGVNLKIHLPGGINKLNTRRQKVLRSFLHSTGVLENQIQIHLKAPAMRLEVIKSE